MAFDFSPNELHRLNHLAFRMRANPTEVTTGERRLRRSGDGYDFLDYRPYSRGDDVRKIDWNLFARFRQLFVRIHESPRQAAITFIIDASRSMGFGHARNKLTQAQLITCGLSFVALRGGDRVYLASFSDTLRRLQGPFAGVRRHRHLVQELQKLGASGKSGLLAAARGVASRRLHRGLVVLISDFLGVDELESVLRIIGSAGGQALGIQILSPDDTGQTLSPGVVYLQDSETGQKVQVRIDDSALAEFRERFRTSQDLLRQQFSRRGYQFLQTSPQDDYLTVVSRAISAGTVHR